MTRWLRRTAVRRQSTEHEAGSTRRKREGPGCWGNWQDTSVEKPQWAQEGNAQHDSLASDLSQSGCCKEDQALRNRSDSDFHTVSVNFLWAMTLKYNTVNISQSQGSISVQMNTSLWSPNVPCISLEKQVGDISV